MLYDEIAAREPIEKGWSGDKKYRITDRAGTEYLLRISPEESYIRREAQHRNMLQAAGLGIRMCLPLEFGRCPEGVYAIQSWIRGNDAEEVIPQLSRDRQYAYGYDAGEILKKLHSIPAPAGLTPWEDKFNRKIDRKLAMYASCPLKYDTDGPMLTYLAENRSLLQGRPQSYQHGDYHIGNMMIDRSGALTVIDFEKDDWGDPWEEFNRIVWCAQKAPFFAAGMVDGYFGCQVPETFWRVLALYICSNSLGSLPWAIPFGEGEIRIMKNQAADILQWYDGFSRIIPSWYQKP